MINEETLTYILDTQEKMLKILKLHSKQIQDLQKYCDSLDSCLDKAEADVQQLATDFANHIHDLLNTETDTPKGLKKQ